MFWQEALILRGNAVNFKAKRRCGAAEVCFQKKSGAGQFKSHHRTAIAEKSVDAGENSESTLNLLGG